MIALYIYIYIYIYLYTQLIIRVSLKETGIMIRSGTCETCRFIVNSGHSFQYSYIATVQTYSQLYSIASMYSYSMYNPLLTITAHIRSCNLLQQLRMYSCIQLASYIYRYTANRNKQQLQIQLSHSIISILQNNCIVVNSAQ